jgi:hypothetical protein
VSDGLRIILLVVMLPAGVAMVCYAGYLQYASLPEEHTRRKGSVRFALAVAGIALIVGGSRLLD